MFVLTTTKTKFTSVNFRPWLRLHSWSSSSQRLHYKIQLTARPGDLNTMRFGRSRANYKTTDSQTLAFKVSLFWRLRAEKWHRHHPRWSFIAATTNETDFPHFPTLKHLYLKKREIKNTVFPFWCCGVVWLGFEPNQCWATIPCVGRQAPTLRRKLQIRAVI